MTLKLAAAALALCLPLAARAPKAYVPVVTDDHVDFAPGGAIGMTGSLGQLNIESWDGPGVQITVTRSTFRTNTPKDLERAKGQLAAYKVTAEKKGAAELSIRTDAPRYGFFARLLHLTPDVQVDYRVRVPRDTKLTLRHGKGDIVVRDVTGDINATVRKGDIVLQLPPAGPYAFDAKCGFGGIYSDFEGTDRVAHGFSERFEANGSGAARKVYLRVGIGGITIQKEAEAPATK
jgi:hypothetical protein